MKIEAEPRAPGPIVTGFGAGGFRVGEESFLALLLTADAAHAWSPPSIDQLYVGALHDLLHPAPEFVLLGTGPILRRPPAALGRALDAQGVGLEVMDSRAAARAWGVLRGEGRRVAAALYPLD